MDTRSNYRCSCSPKVWILLDNLPYVFDAVSDVHNDKAASLCLSR